MAPAAAAAGAAASEERRQLGAAVPGKGSYGAAGDFVENPTKWLKDAARWLETSEETDPGHLVAFCCEDFRPRRLKAPLVLAWLVVQAVGFVFQAQLLGEISRNLSDFEVTLTDFCGPEHRQNGVCLGHLWNMSFSDVLTFPPARAEPDFDFVIPADKRFDFETRSQPPTFLLGVEPLAPHKDLRWRVSVAPRGGGPYSVLASGAMPPVRGLGSRYTVLTSHEHRGPAWTGSITLTTGVSETASVHVYVVDSRIQHLEQIHNQEHCSFEGSWQNFNERHSGQHHRVLSTAQQATTFFLLVQLALGLLVLYRFYFYVESGKLLSRVIALKFVVQDFPQQLCIVAYLYGWYATNGLRCQMCLFHPAHCDAQYPLHWTNMLVCIFTLLSSCANQMLVQIKLKKYDEEEECLLGLARAAALSVSILPFSTSVFFLSASLLHLRSVPVYLAAGVPTMLGWGSLLCAPTMALCDEDDF
mmetsp:Transcript_7350/g.19783  ORF Transcript_7350/g.19783 Transcript_7350/m.19783 type:complete len:472 (-) Transcript_7350:104-1519(-)